MDTIFIDMDFLRKYTSRTGGDFTVHLAPYHRETTHPFQISTIGYISCKNNWVDGEFGSQNFSFILEGSGTYICSGRSVAVQAPCVITQSPGVWFKYGPTPTWRELYLIYEADTSSRFIQRGLLSPERLEWNITEPGAVLTRVEALMALLDQVGEPFAADKIDLLCEVLLLESISHGSAHQMSREEQKVRGIESRMRRDFLADYDFDHIASDLGMHPATFRRYWEKHCPMTPGRFLARLRMNDACRRLVETDSTIAEIAYALKFDDPLYFSRKFRKELGCTASEYRRRNTAALGIP